MSTQTPSLDPVRTRLRETVAVIEKQIMELSSKPGEGDARAALTTAWADLVGQLALGPEPEARNCPHCGSVGARQAKVCGSCWKKLTPPASDDD